MMQQIVASMMAAVNAAMPCEPAPAFWRGNGESRRRTLRGLSGLLSAPHRAGKTLGLFGGAE
jgi:hypothetical protein